MVLEQIDLLRIVQSPSLALDSAKRGIDRNEECTSVAVLQGFVQEDR